MVLLIMFNVFFMYSCSLSLLLCHRFRSSLSKIQLSSGAVAVRACCRVSCPEMALEMIQNKVSLVQSNFMTIFWEWQYG